MTKKQDQTTKNAGKGKLIDDPMDYIDFVAKYHGDDTFKKKVDENPAVAMRSEGLSVPTGVKVKLLPTDENVFHIVLPAASKDKNSSVRTKKS